MKKAFAFVVLATLLTSCSSTSEEDDGSVEVYSSYGCLSTENATTTVPNEWFKIPEAVLEVFKPTLEENISDWYKDTLDLKTTVTDYRLVLHNSSAELEVNTKANMKARKLRTKTSCYVFKTGVYQDKYEVMADGIYRIGSEEKVMQLTDFRATQSVISEIVSEENFTKHFTTIAKGFVSTGDFMVSKADTTYKCSCISDKKIQLDMASPKEDCCTILEKE